MSFFDVVVVGGGHAGTEAAAGAARRGATVALVTFDPKAIGAMSCNPAIGGIGKGHLVREVDAFDGLIARCSDEAAIHYRMLNRSKGVAVHGPRVQADRLRYAAAVQRRLKRDVNITVIEGEVLELIIDGERVAGVELAGGIRLATRAVVLATGTFLNGKLFRGTWRGAGGRVDERAATRLGQQLVDLRLPLGRLKTGTPPRLDGRTIDWAALQEQPSDREPWTMSPMTRGRCLPQVRCGVTRTRDATHDIIRNGLDRSPLFSGAIGGGGPRYCPSIEDKVHRFGDRDGHQIFLEPEGLNTTLVYPNGISTSLPSEVQMAMIESIAGLEQCRIVVPGYAVEYDFVDPRSLSSMLECRTVPGLFRAGQINGTTGYEEAAGQGLVAGLNAAARALELDPAILDRSMSYLGVMIDDLTLQGVTEPYRMLTARAEYRLSLRADNAEVRLSPMAARLGCLSASRLAHVEERQRSRDRIASQLNRVISAAELRERGVDEPGDGSRRTAREWVATGAVGADIIDDIHDEPRDLIAEMVEDARYAPYLSRQAAEVRERSASSALKLGASVKYDDVPGLSGEMKEKLGAAMPATLEEASRIRGVSPAALSAIMLHVKRVAA